jgi:hypothetical protein
VRRRHASHIAVERDPPAHFAYLAPERIALCAGILQSRAFSASYSLCASVAPWVQDRSFARRSPHARNRKSTRCASLHHSTRTLLYGPYRHICVCAKNCGVSTHLSADRKDTYVKSGNPPAKKNRLWEDSRVQAPARGLGAARGSMRASG